MRCKMEKLKNLKLIAYRIALLLSIFSFILPSLLSPLSGESLEVLGYLYKESLHNYYTAVIIIFIILIFIKPIKKYPFLFFVLPILIFIVFYLRMLGIIFLQIIKSLNTTLGNILRK